MPWTLPNPVPGETIALSVKMNSQKGSFQPVLKKFAIRACESRRMKRIAAIALL
jgi:hypothetical protein